MAKAIVTQSNDVVMIQFLGDGRKPEPGTAIIKSPGSPAEVSRCPDVPHFDPDA